MNYTAGEVKNRFVKLTEETLGEILVRVSAITFINIETFEISYYLLDNKEES